MTQTGGNKQGRKWLQCFLPTKYIFQINITKGHMRIHWNVSFIKSIFINLSNSMSLFSMFCCYYKSECLHVVCLFFIFKLHCLKTSITNAVQMIFTKTSATFLTNPFTFSKFFLFCFVIWLSNYWFNTIKTSLRSDPSFATYWWSSSISKTFFIATTTLRCNPVTFW